MKCFSKDKKTAAIFLRDIVFLCCIENEIPKGLLETGKSAAENILNELNSNGFNPYEIIKYTDPEIINFLDGLSYIPDADRLEVTSSKELDDQIRLACKKLSRVSKYSSKIEYQKILAEYLSLIDAYWNKKDGIAPIFSAPETTVYSCDPEEFILLKTIFGKKIKDNNKQD